MVVLMLGSNDLKECFHASAKEIADGAAALVDVILAFTEEKQGFAPKIILLSPPEIGEGIASSPFYGRFLENAVTRSKEFPKYYRQVAEERRCIFVNTAEYIQPSALDSLHLSPEAHAKLAEKLYEVIREEDR
jgi:lysophospholipase L1-like esterase